MSITLTSRFDGTNPAAQSVARKRAAKVITVVSAETKRAIRALIVQSLRAGIAPYEVARHVKTMVGMTTRQTSAASTYRSTLVDSGLSERRVDTLMERYIAKKIRERATNIARSEIMGALHRGVGESWSQARKDDLLTSKQVAEIIVSGDSRTMFNL